jgi:hypothetical protein
MYLSQTLKVFFLGITKQKYVGACSERDFVAWIRREKKDSSYRGPALEATAFS